MTTIIHITFVFILFYTLEVNERNAQDRLKFLSKQQQANFILRVKEKLNLGWEELGRLADAHPRSLRDWARGKHEMGYKSAIIMAKKSGIRIPQSARRKKWSEHVSKVGHLGGLALIKKYGRIGFDEEYRQEKWKEWWEEKGKYGVSTINNQPLSFHVPCLSEKLAEFVGIMMGDGGVSHYQLSITLHRYDDKPYSKFVRSLIKKLFHVDPGVRMHRDALADVIFISRIKMVEYATNTLGLVLGNKVKQQFDIPDWVKENRKYSIACVRGLFDTDGCVFTHKYSVKGKKYAYKKLSFTSASTPLRLSVYDTWSNLGINCRLAKQKDVRIDSRRDVERYFKIIGSHNPKHLKRYSQ